LAVLQIINEAFLAVSAHVRQADFIYTWLKFNSHRFIAVWHCAYNGAAPASLLQYGLRHSSNSGFAATECGAAHAL